MIRSSTATPSSYAIQTGLPRASCDIPRLRRAARGRGRVVAHLHLCRQTLDLRPLHRSQAQHRPHLLPLRPWLSLGPCWGASVSSSWSAYASRPIVDAVPRHTGALSLLIASLWLYRKWRKGLKLKVRREVRAAPRSTQTRSVRVRMPSQQGMQTGTQTGPDPRLNSADEEV